ncbi:peptidase A24A domain protein [Thermanaerovibrio acidaminovorans DSM 6589]|jgi:leader peptidase (prepilin peptidase)/N-methyltransferase|uniref:Peptidase A24A domain protein n=2 Tax=Thermanaerovibrio TaxID=81461 RepID=D1B6Z1_THEAS|nr:A24 family peptidase [Thermanaerovibrio acidaminovorans]ACZ19782.1 peptidase A24A domain protein [Thermanaerovibrio acidaminovorans DSM 6589]
MDLDGSMLLLSVVMSMALGGCMASFVETAAHRLVTGRPFWGMERSRCESCGRELSWQDLVPVVSYLVFRGRCRTCGDRIPPMYLLYEVFTALAFGLMVVQFGFGPRLISGWLMFLFGLFHAVTDLESGYVYDLVSASSFVCGLVLGGLTSGMYGVKGALLGALCGFLPLAAIVVLSFGRMGIGDGILMGGLGAFMGPFGALLGVYLGLFIGGLWAVGLLAIHRVGRKDPIPLAPFLWVGSFLAYVTMDRAWALLEVFRLYL